MELDYRTIFKTLNDYRIDYLVVGGLAVNFHGIPRMTYDIDLMILLESDNILETIKTLTALGYMPKIPVNPADLADESKRNTWIREKNMIAFNFYSKTMPIAEIYLVICSPIPYEELKSRAIKFRLWDEEVPTVSLIDLIDLKLRSGRKQDIADAEHLNIIRQQG